MSTCIDTLITFHTYPMYMSNIHAWINYCINIYNFSKDDAYMNYHFLNVTYENNIAIVEINIPPANTLSTACITELREVIKSLDKEEHIHAVIITGSGRFFVAGADIKEFVPALEDFDKGLAISEAGQLLCNEVEALNKPVIAAINGPALGGGKIGRAHV